MTSDRLLVVLRTIRHLLRVLSATLPVPHLHQVPSSVLIVPHLRLSLQRPHAYSVLRAELIARHLGLQRLRAHLHRILSSWLIASLVHVHLLRILIAVTPMLHPPRDKCSRLLYAGPHLPKKIVTYSSRPRRHIQLAPSPSRYPIDRRYTSTSFAQTGRPQSRSYSRHCGKSGHTEDTCFRRAKCLPLLRSHHPRVPHAP